MAFDQTTRNRLARLVSDARTILSAEFTRQLQHEYGLDPVRGDVTPIDRLTALDDARRETARVLRETMAYYLAGEGGADAKVRREVLDRIVREQAFTVLNRLCAFRMAEARGLILESIGKGYESRGFQLYARLAGGALGERGDVYRTYLFSMMDEFAVDLPVLFDRFSPQGRLFPREAALLKLLELVNDPEIDPLWAEDETIGWIYQYFNSKEERKAMRDASPAPRTSRELAVRNQFFTPRYVVEFLTDNTLGRIWYEMTRGETALKDTCRYLVRRPNEIFLKEGEEAPAQVQAEEDLSQEELLKQPVYIPHRPIKDPRELKMLDPACGSMHFGLYAFDLFEQIYAEAWDLEETLEVGALYRLADLEPLHQTYPDRKSYLRDVPRLIIERNIHGVDIDPRAVQIAGLSLWLRAHRSWQTQGLKPAERPQIRRSNVVCAEPMPGDRSLLEEFLATLREEKLEALMRRTWHVPAGQRVRATRQMADGLAKLVRTVWQEMELAGEAGSLLKVEETLRDAIAAARKESEEKSPLFRVLEYGLNEPVNEHYVQLVAGEDQDFFDRAEGLVLTALREYADQAENGGGYRRRLFAEDATQGFAFIDLCRKRYDVVIMNPPFGAGIVKIEGIGNDKYYKYAISKNLAWGFVERARTFLESTQSNFIGAIVDRTIFQKSSYEEFRINLIKNNWVSNYLDLGFGVLDDADVRASAFVFSLNTLLSPSLFIDVRQKLPEVKGKAVLEEIEGISKNSNITTNLFYRFVSDILDIPFASFAYRLSKVTINSLFKQSTIGELNYRVGGGLQCNDVFRFVRIWPEIRSKDVGINNWVAFYNGGGFSGFWIQNYQYLMWEKNGRDVKAKIEYQLGDNPSRYVENEQMYFLPGIAGGKRGEYFDVHVMPSNMIFSNEGRAFQTDNIEDIAFLLAYLNHPISQNLVNVFCGQHKGSGYLRKIPVHPILLTQKKKLGHLALELAQIKRFWSTFDEFGLEFVAPSNLKFGLASRSLSEHVESINDQLQIDNEKYKVTEELIDKIIKNAFDDQLIEELMDLGWTESARPVDSIELGVPYIKDLTSENNFVKSVIMYVIGVTFGRWDIRFSTGEKTFSNSLGQFEPLPFCSPGMLKTSNEYPAEANEIPADYPIDISMSGVLVDDEGHYEDIERRVKEVLIAIWKEKAEAVEQEACQKLSIKFLREYFRKPGEFFADHLKRYTKSRRAAPIYWPLSTPSCSYTLWLYYHRLTDQTLFTCVNDFVDPKLKQVIDGVARLRLKKGRSTADDKELERLTDLERELKDFREELLRVARFWKPNLNDGIEITASPLWKLFQHKPWQKRLKETWQKLEAGEYDWAHLAYSIHPEQVREKCKTDKSLAIAHGLVALYIEPKQPLKKKKSKMKEEADPDFLFDEV